MPDDDSEKFQISPQSSESFGNVPHPAESFGNVPNRSEMFRTLLKDSERGENHTLTVREVARMFEAAGVARTERSIVNWCQQNKVGISRLDCYFDPNERKYFITPQSVELAISEEKAKAAKLPEFGKVSEDFRNDSTRAEKTHPPAGSAAAIDAAQLEQELMNLKILNGGKDFLIEQLRKERDGFIQQLVSGSRKIGELETRLFQIEGPRR